MKKEKEKEQYQASSVSISNIPDPKKIYKNQQIKNIFLEQIQ